MTEHSDEFDFADVNLCMVILQAGGWMLIIELEKGIKKFVHVICGRDLKACVLTDIEVRDQIVDQLIFCVCAFE